LHLKYPWPVDHVQKVNTRRIRQLNVGNVQGSAAALIWTRPHGTEVSFLSGDNNFVNPYVVIHYRIKDPYSYLYRQAQPEMLLEQISYRVLTESFSTETFHNLAIRSRKEWTVEVRRRIEREIDRYKTGLEIVNLCLKDLHPPRRIAGTFEKVIAAYQVKQESINLATGYVNVTLPAARANADQQVAEARAYQVDRQCRAKGDSRRFLLRLSQYGKYHAILKRELYLQAMTESLKDAKKVLVSPAAGVSEVWLLPEFMAEYVEMLEH